MFRLLTIFIIICFIQIEFNLANPPLSPRTASYDIDVILDNEKKILDGYEILTWKNPSPDTIHELQFHLYLNAFRNSQSTFLKSGEAFGTPPNELSEEQWGWTDILSIKTQDSTELLPNTRFIQTTFPNEHDQTVMQLNLDDPVLPYKEIKLYIKFKAKIPRLVARTGYSLKDYHFIVQWFPKTGVYEWREGDEKGQWKCHNYHRSTEYYSDFGLYNVSLTVPDHFIVGASGERMSYKKNNNGTQTVQYRAEDVIDFAWTASPDFIEYKDQWRDTEIRLLIQPEHNNFKDRYIESAKYAMEFMAKHLAPYPYSTFTIVDPPAHGIRSCCMEYPTLMTGLSFCCMPNDLRTIEIITTHEFLHQYFMQILASNESEEAWLDEGFVSYFEDRIMDERFGTKRSVFDLAGYHWGNREDSRLRYTRSDNPKIAEPGRLAWEFNHGGYNTMSYSKTATGLATLENILGLELMDEIVRAYYEKWKFKHPKGQDFFDVANEIVKEKNIPLPNDDLDWYFKQIIYESNICDYTVASISNKKSYSPGGYFSEEFSPFIEDSLYNGKVIFHRLGEVQIPQEILITYENGDTSWTRWDGQKRSFEFTSHSPFKIISAQIDPSQKILLDINLNNNSKTLRPSATPKWKYTSKAFFWVQNILQFAAGFF